MFTYNIMLLGSGGRESALAKKISESPLCNKLYIAPGNGGTGAYGENVNLKISDFQGIKDFMAANSVNLVVCGSEDPLVGGLRNFLSDTGVLFVGPGKDGAGLEGSKDFAKQFMLRHGIPTAKYLTVTAENLEEGVRFMAQVKAPYVLKADGLAAGKGVLIVPTLEEAEKSLREMLDGKFGEASARVVIEEFLSGIECSVFAVLDGTGGWRLLGVAKDYKRVGEGDTGLNTGGMGAVSPVPFADEAFMKRVEDKIIVPTVKGLIADGIDYRGFVFFGLMRADDGEPKVIEYNVRMGDPETEVVIPRLKSDLVELMAAVAKGDLSEARVKTDKRAAVTVMAVSKGYPEAYKKGFEITLPAAMPAESVIYHAGTAVKDGKLVTSGGRVLAVTSLADDIYKAVEKSYRLMDEINFEGKTFRRDITRDLK